MHVFVDIVMSMSMVRGGNRLSINVDVKRRQDTVPCCRFSYLGTAPRILTNLHYDFLKKKWKKQTILIRYHLVISYQLNKENKQAASQQMD